MTTQKFLLAVFDQFESTSGKLLIQALLDEMRRNDLTILESNITETLVFNIQRFSNYRVSDKQLYRLAQAVERNHIDLNPFLEKGPSVRIEGDRKRIDVRGIVISTSDIGIDVLLSDGTTCYFSNCSYSSGIFVEIKNSKPELSFFRDGQDEAWLEKIWPKLAEEFEKGKVEQDAFVIAGRKVRIGLVEGFFKKSQRADKEDVYKRIINSF